MLKFQFIMVLHLLKCILAPLVGCYMVDVYPFKNVSVHSEDAHSTELRAQKQVWSKGNCVHCSPNVMLTKLSLVFANSQVYIKI